MTPHAPAATTPGPEATRLPLVAAALVALACGGADRVPRTAVPDSVYVEVMARLVLVDSAMTSQAEVPLGPIPRDSARRLVLDRYEVTEDELLEFARTVGEHPRAMAELWRRVQERADSLRASHWTPAGEASGSGGGTERPDHREAETDSARPGRIS